jgi:DNA-binding transcriptional LysR family regulator
LTGTTFATSSPWPARAARWRPGVNQTTCARRLQALEEALGQRLFDRVQTGRVLTEAGHALVPAAEAVEAAVRGFEEQAAARRRGLSGALRVTCSETLANVAVIPALAQFNQLYPEIEVEVLTSDRYLDLVAGEADIAIRAMSNPAFGSGLVVRKLMDTWWGLYCSLAYAERYGRCDGMHDLAGHLMIGGSGELAEPWFRVVEDQARGVEIRARASTLTNLITAVKSGVGIAPLPMEAAENDPGLIRCGPPLEEFRASVWLVAPERLRDHPRARAFMDFVTAYLAATRNKAERRGAGI